MKRRGVVLLAGFGGYPSFAPAVAAKSLQLPLLLHEQATRLSMANRRLLGYADALATSFPRVAGTNGFDPARVTETGNPVRSEEHTSELQSLMRISYAVFCLKKKKNDNQPKHTSTYNANESRVKH